MIRVEVIGNEILLQEFLDCVEKQLPNSYYTVLNVTRAKGKKEKQTTTLCDSDKNFLCLMFVSDLCDVKIIRGICDDIKQHSTQNALTMFESKVFSHLD